MKKAFRFDRLGSPIVLPAAVLAFTVLLGAGIVFGFEMTPAVDPQAADAGLINKTFNFTITNGGPGDIMQVNITLPEGFEFNRWTNRTHPNCTFDNDTGRIVYWTNLNITYAAVNVSTTEYFWFNATVPKTASGTYNFNVSTKNNTGNINTTNVSITVFATVWSSPLQQFYLKPIALKLNWTNGYADNLTITMNGSATDLLNISFMNGTSNDATFGGFAANYSQSGQPSDYCNPSSFHLYVRNYTGDYDSALTGMSAGGSKNVTLMYNSTFYDFLACKPGRYNIQNFVVRNTNRTNETSNVSVQMDIPITTSNSLSSSTGEGTFNGIMPANATAYHSFYFNASRNASGGIIYQTGVMVNVSFYNNSFSAYTDLDVFLVDSAAALKAKSINKNGTVETLRYSYLTNADNMWEIRVYGNSTNSTVTYTGQIRFTTLNITNTTNGTLSILNFGALNATSNASQDILLRNFNDVVNSTNVNESREMYYFLQLNASAAKNFTVIIPDSSMTKRLKVRLNWTGATNYTLQVYNQTGALLGTSAGKHALANVTGMPQEEYVVLGSESIGSTSSEWRIGVTNATNVTGDSPDPYAVLIYAYVNASDWVNTNFSSAPTTTIRSTGIGANISVNVSLSVPAAVFNGTYLGTLSYLASNGAGIELPLRVDVTVPMIVVNQTATSNATATGGRRQVLGSETYRLDENYNVSGTRSLYFNINNTGSIDLSIKFTDSGNLSCASGSACSGYNASFVYNNTTSVAANSFTTIYVNINFNESMPAGLYTGWIKINGTNSTAYNTSRPYNVFTMNLQLNLTNLLDITDVSISTYDGDAMTTNTTIENVTAIFKIKYLNGTDFPDAKSLNINTSNFTISLVETNVSYRVPSSGSLTLYNGTNPIYTDKFRINFTVPANSVGGRYRINITGVYNNIQTGNYYYAVGGNSSFLINNTGLNASTNRTSYSLSNSSTSLFYVNLSNYGPLATSSAWIEMRESCSGFTIAATSYSCPGATVALRTTAGAQGFTVTDLQGFNTSCLLWWTISVPAGTGTTAACNATEYTDTANGWFDPNLINVSVSVTAPSGGSSPPSGGATDGTTANYVANLEFTKAEPLVGVRQNETNTTTVIVKNTGNKSQSIIFTITNITSSLWSVNATTATLARDASVGFLVTFSPGSVAVSDRPGYYKAYSSEKTIESSFIMRINPGAKNETTINISLVEYRARMLEVLADINASRALGVNVTAADANYTQLKTTLEQAEAYIAGGDYFHAYQLLDEIESLLTKTEAALKTAKEAHVPQIDWLFWGIVIGGVAVGAFLLYLFWPSKTGFKQ